MHDVPPAAASGRWHVEGQRIATYAGETPPGAFDDAQDFARHDLIRLARTRTLTDAPVWIDVGRDDPFRDADLVLARALRSHGTRVRLQLHGGGHGGWSARMPEYLSPGVYVEEVEAGSRPIEGVGTAVAAFVGLAARGPFNEPTLITNWSQFVQTFGEFQEGSYLAHAVYGFFQNGGNLALNTLSTITSTGEDKTTGHPER